MAGAEGPAARGAGAGAAGGGAPMPQKRHFRQRAHANPLSEGGAFAVPRGPGEARGTWAALFPAPAPGEDGEVRFVDVGCGFGGMTLKLGELFPGKRTLGIEIRAKVSAYVAAKVAALREREPGRWGNVACLRTNAQKYLPHYFRRGQLEKLLFLFPDPHFKRRNHVRRIVSPALLTEYAFLLAPGGLVYTATDVEALGVWMREALEAHPLFEEVPADERAADPVVPFLTATSEEAQKVERNAGRTWTAVFRRVGKPPPQA